VKSTDRVSLVRFGSFELNLESGELRRSGVRIRLQQQPFKVLEALLEQPGRIVTREDLRSRIWPNESFGDFDQAVNVAVTKLRTVLGDSASSPRFIETLPRRGYRFIAPIQNEPAGKEAGPTSGRTEEVSGSQPSFLGRRTALVIAAVLVVGAVAALTLRLRPKDSAWNFSRVSFGKGSIRSARFASDGQSIFFGASWDGKPSQVFWTQPESAESRPYTSPDTDVLAVSRGGQLAVLKNRRAGVGWISHGTLALMSLGESAPREILDNVQDADWDEEGKDLAVVHWVGDHCRLEFPIGVVLYETAGGHWFSNVRISPRGDLIAFMDHPLEGDDAGSMAVIDLNGRAKVLTSGWLSLHGLVWDPSGDSIWFSGNEVARSRQQSRAVYNITLSGKQRKVFQQSDDVTVQDISRSGRLLVTQDVMRYEVMGRFSGEARDLSWLDFSRADDLSLDGRSVLFTVEGEAVGQNYEVFLRGTDGGPPMRLGEGYGSAISPDGRWVLAVAPFGTASNSTPQFVLLPVGMGQAKVVTRDPLVHLAGSWFSDGSRIAFKGSEPGHSVRTWIQNLAGGAPTPITPEGVAGTQISADGKSLCAVDAEGRLWIYPVEGGNPTQIKGTEPGESPVRWAKDGKSLFVAKSDSLPVRVYRIELASGRQTLVQQLEPRDPAGVLPDVSSVSSSVFATPDGTSFVYSYFRMQSDLFVASPK
jgi:DNA-binding winged helix-turn-helix (wHTH) protein/Tol biopolymer transport system component